MTDLTREQMAAVLAAAESEAMARILGLDEVQVSVSEVRMFGTGARATVEIDVSNGETLTFDSVRDMLTAAGVIAEVAGCTGATPALTQKSCARVVALVRQIAKSTRVETDNETARSWGLDYLQVAEPCDVDMADQAGRWQAFADMDRYRAEGENVGIVLLDKTGLRYVRSGWFLQFIRNTADVRIGQVEVARRMPRVGWSKRGRLGRIKATAPGFNRSLGWNFWAPRYLRWVTATSSLPVPGSPVKTATRNRQASPRLIAAPAPPRRRVPG